jgi:DNA-binding response OmpR family regulator
MTPELPHLLLAEDDRVLASLLVEVLSDAYLVTQVPDGQAALHAALTRSFDVMVIDRGLPAIEGADLVKRLRSRGLVTPILLLTARGTTADRVEGLDAGAEDYLVKPFEIDELLARLRALLRRHRDQADVLEIGARRLEASSHRVVGGGRAAVELSPRETRLLEILARHPNRVFTRQELLEAVFDSNDGSGAVDTYVYYLRQKLGRTAIRTVHGLGYQLGAP